jgi:hypothetical protein
LLPLGGVAVVKPTERGSPEETRRPAWDGFAIQREQAPSPQKLPQLLFVRKFSFQRTSISIFNRIRLAVAVLMG